MNDFFNEFFTSLAWLVSVIAMPWVVEWVHRLVY